MNGEAAGIGTINFIKPTDTTRALEDGNHLEERGYTRLPVSEQWTCLRQYEANETCQNQ